MINTDILELKLEEGVIRFTFRKKDGSVRTALGTRNLSLIPKEDAPKNPFEGDRALTYWDLEARNYRAVSWNSEVEIVG